MGTSVNRCILVGRLGKTPELSYLPSGVPMVKFSVATSETWTDKADGTKQERTEWHNIVAWRSLAELCAKYLVKGKMVYLDGKIQTRNYEDKDGVKRYITELVADNMVMMSRAESEGHSTPGSDPVPPPEDIAF